MTESLVETVHHPLRIRRLTVTDVRRPTPRLVRVTLGGPELAGFCRGAPDDHVKVFFPERGATEPLLPELGERGVIWPTEGPRPIARDYTPVDGTDDDGLVLDLVLHDGGHASDWADAAEVGDVVGVAGPRGSHVFTRTFDRYVLVGDETALPAIRNRVLAAPDGARVDALVEVVDADDHQDIGEREGHAVRWIHRGPAAPGTTDHMVRAARELDDLDGDVFVWIAGEADVVRAVRATLAERWSIDSERFSARGYWRRGAVDHQEPHDD